MATCGPAIYDLETPELYKLIILHMYCIVLKQ